MKITKEFLSKYLSYNPSTGVFTRKTDYNSFRSGDITGSPDNHGYIILSVKGKRIKAHRAAMIMCFGEAPRIVDHINGIKNDNRIENLRGVTSQDSSRNASMMQRNTSGRVGVYWNKRESKWHVRICGNNGVRIHLGYFKSKIDAVAERIRAEKRYKYHENHGRLNPNTGYRRNRHEGKTKTV